LMWAPKLTRRRTGWSALKWFWVKNKNRYCNGYRRSRFCGPRNRCLLLLL
jgi:hypothetical protein